MEVVNRAGDADQLLAMVDARPPDIVITDIRMPPTHTTEGLVAAAQIRERHPGVAVLLLSQYVETTHALRLLERGAGRFGYLLKDRVSDVREFIDAVRRVAGGSSAIDPDVVSQLLVRRRQRPWRATCAVSSPSSSSSRAPRTIVAYWRSSATSKPEFNAIRCGIGPGLSGMDRR